MEDCSGGSGGAAGIVVGLSDRKNSKASLHSRNSSAGSSNSFLQLSVHTLCKGAKTGASVPDSGPESMSSNEDPSSAASTAAEARLEVTASRMGQSDSQNGGGINNNDDDELEVTEESFRRLQAQVRALKKELRTKDDENARLSR